MALFGFLRDRCVDALLLLLCPAGRLPSDGERKPGKMVRQEGVG